MVTRRYTRDDHRLPAELKRIQRSLDDAQRPTGTERERSLMRLQEQVDELFARSTHTVSPADVNLTADTPGEFPTVSRSFSFPPPQGGGRVATLALSADFVRTSSSGNMTIFLELLQAGSVTWRRTGALVVGDTASAPPAWGQMSLNDFIQVTVPSESAAGMAVRLYAHTFMAGTVTARMQNIQATLTYGPRL